MKIVSQEQEMGSERSEIGVKIRKGLIFTIRCCSRSVCRHPFLVGFLCFLILLYRSSPFVFSLLVSASPILICTAVLLGVLLSYGEPNIPEIEIEEKKANFETNGIYFIKEKGSDVTAPLIEERSQEIESEGFGEKRSKDSDDTALLIEEGSQEIKEEGENRELSDLKLKTEWVDEKHNDAILESDSDKSEADSFDSEKVNVDSLDSPPRSPWTRIEGDEDEHAEEEDSGSDSESDRAESSSPDASMADIMPMLDELHPLLDEEMIPHQSIRGSRSGSDVALNKSLESSTESFESGDESEENNGSLDDGEDDDDVQGEKEEPTKSAIMWTEEDQKNLMDLGSSEIERNQRLENLIMRRRSKKYMNMDLIDLELESTDHPLSLAPISTRRKNPFDDLTHDSYDNMGLPPIPGSAPSVMLQRRNPFDIPYDSSEEKPDLMGDGFKEEFATSQSRGPTFKRHESFNVGPSVFAPGGKGARMRPYFVPESMISEESNYSSSSYMRQLSGLSESKVSSVPETESTGSVQDLDERKLSEEDNQQEIELSPQPNEVFEGPSEEPHLSYHHEEEGDEEEEVEEEVNGAPELISEIENVPELVGHGSESSDDEESQGSGRGELEIQLEDEEVYRRDSSSSSLSEESERVFTEVESEGFVVFSERRDVGILTQTSRESLNLVIPHRGPVYDSSPRPNENILPETSIAHPMYVVDPRDHEDVIVDSSEVEKETSEVSTSLNLSAEISAVEEHGLGEISGAKDDEKIHNLNKSLEDQFEFSEPKEVRETVRSLDYDGDAFQRTDEFISTDSVEGNAYPIHDADEIGGPNFQHLDEVLASSALIDLETSEDAQITENSNTHEAQEIDFNIPSNMHSEAVEEVDVINEIGLDLLAELDNVGDFSVQQWRPSEFERHVDSVEESEIEDLVHLEKSREDIDIEEEGVERIDVSRTEFDESEGQDSPNSKTSEKHEEKADEKIESFSDEDESIALVENDITYTENSNGMSELEAGKIEDIDAVFREITATAAKTPEIEVQPDEKNESFSDEAEVAENEVTNQGQADTEMTDVEASKVEDIHVVFREITANAAKTPEIEVQPGEKIESFSDKAEVAENEVTNQGQADTGMTELEAGKVEDIHAAFREITANAAKTPEIEVQPDEKIESFSEKDDLTESEVTNQGQADTEMTDLEASKVEDIDLAIKEIIANETIVNETLVENSMDESSNVVGSTLESSVLEAVPVEKETSLDSKQSLSDSVDHALHVIEPEETPETFSEQASREHEVLSKENEARTVNYVGSHDYEGNLAKTPEIEVQPMEKIESFSGKAEVAGNEVNYQGQADTEMTDLEASKVEDIDLAFKEITTKETIVKETLAEHSKNQGQADTEMTDLEASKVEDIDLALKEITAKETIVKETLEEHSKNQGQADTEMTDLEASKVEDIDLAFKEITAKEMIVKDTLAEHSKDESSNLAGFSLESSVLEAVPIEKDTSLDSKQSLKKDTSLDSKQSLPDSTDQPLHETVSEETKGISSRSIVTGTSVLSEETTLPQIDRALELVKPDSEDKSVEVKADEVGPSVEVKKPDSGVETPKNYGMIPSVKGKDSKSSSSSSSSSSDSSSSDSDKE